jgi:undecaprenyl-phosphate galactose phosphotransferase
MYQLGFWRTRVLEIRIDTDYSLKYSFIRNKFIGYWVVESEDFSLEKDTLTSIVEKVKVLKEKHDIDTISVIVKEFASPKISELVERLYFVSGHVLLVPELMDLDVLNADVYHMMYENLFVFDINKGLNSPMNRLLKRLIDIVLATVGIIVFSPVLIVVSLLIAIKDGFPVLYGQDRYGKGGKVFNFHKFRTMRKESYKDQNDDRLWEYLNANPEIKANEWDKYQKLEHDPRILPGINIVRRTSLDELAQLFNVLKGEMSVVGPRPFLPRERDLIGDYFDRVVAAKPGITDLWTVSGRDALSFDQRLRMSTWYIQNWSIWLDFVIIAKTIQQVILYFAKWLMRSKKQ